MQKITITLLVFTTTAGLHRSLYPNTITARYSPGGKKCSKGSSQKEKMTKCQPGFLQKPQTQKMPHSTYFYELSIMLEQCNKYIYKISCADPLGQLVLGAQGWVHQFKLLVDYTAGTGSVVVGRGYVVGFFGLDSVESFHRLLV